jgi:chorismate mutase
MMLAVRLAAAQVRPSTTSSWSRVAVWMNSTAAASLWWRVPWIIEQARARERQHRPHPLAAAGDQMAGQLGISGISDCIRVEDDRVDLVHVGATRAIIGSSEGAPRRMGCDRGAHAARWRADRQRQASRLALAAPSPQKAPMNTEDRVADAQLDEYRQSIDNIDAALIFMLAERFKVTQAVGATRRRPGLPPADPSREERRSPGCALAKSARLDPDFSRNSCASSSTK